MTVFKREPVGGRTFRLFPALLLALSGCSSGADETISPPPTFEGKVPELSRVAGPPPARDYANACGTCHDNGGYAVRVLADRLGPQSALIHRRNTLSPDTIRSVVRNGVGAMPAMSKLEVSDAELDGIIALLGKARMGSTS